MFLGELESGIQIIHYFEFSNLCYPSLGQINAEEQCTSEKANPSPQKRAWPEAWCAGRSHAVDVPAPDKPTPDSGAAGRSHSGTQDLSWEESNPSPQNSCLESSRRKSQRAASFRRHAEGKVSPQYRSRAWRQQAGSRPGFAPTSSQTCSQFLSCRLQNVRVGLDHPF